MYRPSASMDKAASSRSTHHRGSAPVDVLKCENCGGRTTVLAFLTERAAVKKILEHLGLPATGPPKAPARGAAQLELDERPADELWDELPNYDS